MSNEKKIPGDSLGAGENLLDHVEIGQVFEKVHHADESEARRRAVELRDVGAKGVESASAHLVHFVLENVDAETARRVESPRTIVDRSAFATSKIGEIETARTDILEDRLIVEYCWHDSARSFNGSSIALSMDWMTSTVNFLFSGIGRRTDRIASQTMGPAIPSDRGSCVGLIRSARTCEFEPRIPRRRSVGSLNFDVVDIDVLVHIAF